jgi:transcription elongation factor Elf1
MWCAHPYKCHLCGHRQTSVYESDTDLLMDNLQCGSCGQMTSEPDAEAMDDFDSSMFAKNLLSTLDIPVQQ